ncbi:MAG: hypothetical protein HYY92_02965 [Parcubacteria group bacterium]|nr:hypothetical protein [Parcubacteria group bacterium]
MAEFGQFPVSVFLSRWLNICIAKQTRKSLRDYAKQTLFSVGLAFLFGVSLAAMAPASAYAAELSFIPAQGSYKVGDAFPVSVVVSSADKAMNAASGRVLFPPSKLEVTHISKGSSVLDLWIQEPSYSNSAGTIDFEGIAFNPGYQGVRGEILTVTFKVKSSGSIPVSFASGSVLANDGQGTDILTSLGSALFDISGGSAVVPPASVAPTPKPPVIAKPPSATKSPVSVEEEETENDPPVQAGTPRAPKIASLTHPKESGWYPSHTATFSWEMPEDVTAVRLLYGTQQNATPSILYNELISEKTIEDVPEGTYYFHVQLKNAAGWGEITHFRFRVDGTLPESLLVTEEGKDNSAGPQFTYFSMRANDALSGIDRYEIAIDGGLPEIRQGNIGAVWSAPRLRDGTHTLTVTAMDKAGNLLTENRSFEVENTSFIMLGTLAYLDVGFALLTIVALVLLAFMLGWTFHEMGGWIIFLPLFLLFRFAHRLIRLEKKIRPPGRGQQSAYAKKTIPKRRI